MISFNPYLRPKVEECLEHPFFEKLRRPSFEISAPSIINLKEIDSDESPQPPSMSTLKRIISDEVNLFKAKRLHEGINHILDPIISSTGGTVGNQKEATNHVGS